MSIRTLLLRRTPLGWKQLTHARGRLAVATAGVAFAVLLIFMQLGFMNMLYDSAVMIHRKLDADIVLVSMTSRDFANPGTFPRSRLLQAMGVPGVADAEALYVTSREWIKQSENDRGERGQMLLIGVRPDFKAFRDPEISANQHLLVETGAALFDRKTRGDYIPFLEAIERAERPQTELAGRTVTLVGTLQIGSSFDADGVLIVSDQTFFEFAINRIPSAPSVGLVRVALGHDVATVASAIRARFGLYDDTMVMTMSNFIEHSKTRIQEESAIGFVFTFGVIIGMIVGVVIVLEILSADVHDHLAEYATFKAMGFTNRALLGVVFEQSLILSIAGFVPGLLVSLGLYAVVRSAVTMPIGMTAERLVVVLGLTVTMCAISGAIAMRRVRNADPADVF